MKRLLPKSYSTHNESISTAGDNTLVSYLSIIAVVYFFILNSQAQNISINSNQLIS